VENECTRERHDLTFILDSLENHVTKISRTLLQQICVNTQNEIEIERFWTTFLLTKHK
jgi:hypothetical protein